MSKTDRGFAALLLLGMAALLATAGCRQDMHDQPKLRGLRESRFHEDRLGARPAPAGTIPRGFLRDDALLAKGIGPDGKFADAFPFPVTAATLARGRQRFDVFCSPCHDRSGSGHGTVVQRGFKQPPALFEERLRKQPAGYFLDVATNGFGTMSGYASQVSLEDRWAIVAWVRALQYAAHAPASDLGAADLEALEKSGPPPAAERRGTAEPPASIPAPPSNPSTGARR
jgi:mono/diheme cytochrome c family protein